MTYANNKGADQPAHPHSLISTFVVRCLDRISSNVLILLMTHGTFDEVYMRLKFIFILINMKKN